VFYNVLYKASLSVTPDVEGALDRCGFLVDAKVPVSTQSPSETSHGIHARASAQDFVLVPKLADLQKGICSISFQTV